MTEVLNFPFWLLVVHPVLFFIGIWALVLLCWITAE